MKRFLLSLVTVLCLAVTANAQAVFGYGLSLNEESTYTALTDGTIIASGSNEALRTSVDEWGNPLNNFNDKVILPSGIFAEETTAEGYSIGFDFIFNEKTFTSFGIATNGAVYLGNETVTVPVEENYIFNRESAKNLIGFVCNRGNICNDETVIRYKTEGEAPNRVLVIEFEEYGMLQGWVGTAAYYFDVQFRLYEGSNNIEIILNNVDEAMTGTDDDGNPETYSTLVTIGVKGEDEKHSKVFAGELSEWAAENGTTNNFTIDNEIKDGITFSFAYPEDVVAPTVQATDFVVNNFSTEFKGSFKKVEGVDTYLLVYQEGKEITTLPSDKTLYAPEDKVGEATVIEYYESREYEDTYEFELWDLTSGTDYTFAVYAVNSFGTNGPLYNIVDVPTVVTFTNPAAATLFEFVEVGETTAKINLDANEEGNKVIVVYSTELVRDNYGDYALIGELSGEYEAGQEIEGGGKVAYFGEAGENIEITGLEHSNSYFFEAYSYDPAFGYSTDKLSADVATIAHIPYFLDFSKAKNYGLPAGWTKNEDSGFEVPNSVSGYTSEENPYVLWCKVTRNDATTGSINEVTSSPILIDKDEAVVKFDFAMYYQPSRFATDAYNEWTEGDVFSVQISTDGENFTDLVTYTPDNHPEFVYTSESRPFVPFVGDLSDYKDETIWVRIHWHLFSTNFTPGVLVIDNFSVETLAAAVIPEVTINNITHNSALVKWRGEQENYEVAYAKATEEEFVTKVVEAATELELTELEAETAYQVKVRGIIAEEEYTEWSEIGTFTTKAWPECEAPTELEADVTAFAEDGTVTLTWDGNEEHLYYEVQYREGSSTTWVTIDSLTEATVVLEDLEAEATYLWRVRANCTVDRVTDWSAQATFETPEISEGSDVLAAPVITAEVSNDTIYVSWEAVEGAVGYNLYYQKQLLSSFTETEVAVTIVQAGEYCFTVTAYNAAKEESEHSNEACETVTAPEGLEVPEATVLSAKIENDSVVLSWNSVESATYYVVYFGDKLLGNHNGTTLSLALPEPGTYCFTVAAANLAGESEPSNEACVTYGDGLEELSASINIYPNPVQNELFIATEFEVESVAIYDIYGRQALSQQVSKSLSHQVIDVAGLNSGIYFVKVVTSNGEIVKRFVKK